MAAARLRPLGIGEILDAAIKVYRARFATLVKATFIVVAPVQVLSAVVRVSVPDVQSATKTNAFGQRSIDAAAFVGAAAALVVVGLLGVLASELATAASLKIVSSAYLDEEEDWRASLRFAGRHLRSIVWLLIKVGVLVGLGFLACVVPGVYFYNAWALAIPVLLMEEKRGKQAMKRSRELVSGRWWPVFGTLLVASILTGVVTVAFTAVAGGITAAIHNTVVEAIVLGIASVVGSVLATPFAAAVRAILYFDLRVRKEGFDLELLARTLGVEPPPDSAAPAWAADGPAPGSGGQPPFWPPPPGWEPPPGGVAPAPADAAASDAGSSQPPFWPPPPGWRPEGQ